MIWEQLNENLIFDSLDAQSTDHIFEQIGSRLIEEGYCHDTYVNALKKREAEFPTGLDMDGIGIAIPHTDITHVKRNGIAIAKLNDPVRFIQMGTDDEPVDVHLVFMLSVKEPGRHIEHLQRIIEIIQDRKVLERLYNAKGPLHVIQIIRSKEIEIEHSATLEMAMA